MMILVLFNTISSRGESHALLEGIEIVSSLDLQNRFASIHVKCEFDSNVIDESDLQFKKQFEPRISTFFGIKID
jgi:hypothetical protein